MKKQAVINSFAELPAAALIKLGDAAYKAGKAEVAAGEPNPELKRGLAKLRLQLAVAKELQAKGVV